MNNEPNIPQQPYETPAASDPAPSQTCPGREAPAPAFSQPLYEAPASVSPAKNPYDTTLMEKVIAWLAWPVAFCYVQFLWLALDNELPLKAKIFLLIFVGGFLAAGEVLHRKEKISLESVLWAVSEIALFIAFSFELGRVWKGFHLILFLHLFAPYWLLTRGRRLSEDARTSHMFFWDGLTAFFILPFKNFHLLFCALASTFTGKPGTEKKGRGLRVFLTIASVAAGIILLIIALSLLSSADNTFADSLERFWEALGIRLDVEFFVKLFLSGFVAIYVYGMAAGSFRETKERFGARSGGVLKLLERIKKVPAVVWFVFILLFSVFYVLFFVLQYPYFINAFRLELPEGFNYSQYAVQGLMELLGIMIVNFLLLWLATRTSKKSPLIKAGGTILLLETLLFAVIDFLKIYMYLRVYGFTPLRLQGIWLTTVLTFATVCMLISLLSGKKTARIWFIGSAVTLVALAFV